MARVTRPGRAYERATLRGTTATPRRAADLTDAMEGFARPAAEAVVRHRLGHVVGISNLGRGVPGYAGVVTHGLAVDDVFAATAWSR
jgi:hypothetical protein